MNIGMTKAIATQAAKDEIAKVGTGVDNVARTGVNEVKSQLDELKSKPITLEVLSQDLLNPEIGQMYVLYKQYLEDFNDGVLDLSKWNIFKSGDTPTAETSVVCENGKLKFLIGSTNVVNSTLIQATYKKLLNFSLGNVINIKNFITTGNNNERVIALTSVVPPASISNLTDNIQLRIKIVNIHTVAFDLIQKNTSGTTTIIPETTIGNKQDLINSGGCLNIKLDVIPTKIMVDINGITASSGTINIPFTSGYLTLRALNNQSNLDFYFDDLDFKV